ncbi:glycerate kinase type-2 family protein [Halobellus ruber]|uniref:glycerate kinase type-2 family protein n=1 Tax=Halobellus ruber TaxID=2761102 RepID=UPI0031B6154A
MIDRGSIRAGSPAVEVVLDAVAAGIDAARPGTVLRDAVGVKDGGLTVGNAAYDLAAYDEVLFLGGGNAAGRVASHLPERLGPARSGGVVVTDDPVPVDGVDVVEGTHPVPSEPNREGTRRLLERARAADGDTLVVVAVTGGGSALLAAPVEGVTLADLRELTDVLVRSGAPIDRINAVRKHVSAVKGGRLARALTPATTVGVVFSDVTADDPSVVGSGPISPDPTSYDDALTVLSEYDVDAPESVTQHLERGAAGEVAETPAADDPAFDDVSVHVLANNATAVGAAREACADRGFEPLVLSSSVRGASQAAAVTHVAVAEEVRRRGDPVEPPAAILSGGETTVAVGKSGGTGGPNQEFALRAAVDLPARTVCCAVDTDGRDGPTDAAGAVVDPDTVDDRRSAREALAAHDVHGYLEERGALVRTGTTGTNVNDLRVLLVPE